MAIIILVVLALVVRIIPANKELEKIEPLRKLFTSTSLSTALLSFISTMGGLQLYIFQNNFVSAFVLSGAIQGALFGISTEFFGIIGKFSKKISKSSFIVIWLLLLLFSSGFSYVGISKTAYPDDVLKDDSEQILIQYCIDTDNELLGYIRTLEPEYLKNIYEYINTLNGGEEGFTLSQQDKQIFADEKTALKEYQNILEIDNGDGTTTNAAEIKAILNTEMLCTYIDTIQNGNYGNELNAYKVALDYKIDDANGKKSDYDKRYDDENKLIVGDPTADTEAARLGFNGRSAQYRNLSDPNFIKLQQDIETAEANKVKFKALSDKLDDFIKCLEECKRFVENDFETGTENDIYQKTLSLKKEVNKETIEVNKVITLSEEIYDDLISNNTSATDDRIAKYAIFKNDIKEYKNVIEQKQVLESELEVLNDYSSELITIETDPVDTSSLTSTASNANPDIAWKKIWSNHLIKIQLTLKQLPDEYGTISLPRKKAKYLEEIFDRRRLYLTNINDFDRAWSLLFSNFHPLKNKIMLFVSIVIAFGLDLISFAMGCLLSKIKAEDGP